MLLVLIFAQAAWISPAQAQTSTLCPVLNATVAYGGSVSINAGSCHAGFGLGNIATQASHGTGSVGAFGPNQTINYAHNGTSGTTDFFVVRDGNAPPNNLIRVNITILPPASSIVVSPAALPALTAGTPFSQTLTSTGGAAPYTYSLSTGTLPPGLTLSSGGVLSGTPTQRGAYTFSVRSQDSTGAFADKGYTGSVANPTLSITPTAATATQGITFSQTLTAVGGVGPHSYLLETGSFPVGISISSAGVISGMTSAAAGNYPVTLRVTDSSTGPGSYFELETFTLTVAALPTVSIAVAPASVAEDGAPNLVYTVTRSATSASALTVNLTTSGTATSGSDYSGAVSSVTIPANATTTTVTINPSADVFAESNETVVISVASGAGYTIGAPSSATGTITNDDTPLGSTSPHCPTQSLTVANSGSVTSMNLAACDGNFNIGMAPAAAAPPLHGTINLSPQTGPGNQTVTYTHNGNSATSDRFGLEDQDGLILTFNVTINPATSSIVVSPTGLASLTAGVAFSQTLTSTGGTAPYTYTLSGGSLPPGLSLTAGGILSGTPSQRGNYTFSVRSQDSVGAFTDKGYSGTVTNPTLTLAPTSATAVQGQAFSQTLATTGGIAPYTYALETGSLPAGITISPTGVVSGTTSAAPGNYAVTLRVTDSSTGPGSYFELEPFTLTVAALPTVSIAVAPASVSEDGATNLVYTVTRSAASASAMTVNLTTSGTATSGSDYTGAVSSVTIAANATTATVTINPTADLLLESNETVIMTVAAGTGYTVGSPSSATGTINNDETSSPGGASTYCPVLNVTVANGGSVQINVSSCDGPFDGGMSNGGVLNPTNGSYVIGSNSGGVQFVTYAHNGNSATSDRFELLDNNNGIVTINITISPPTSSIVVSPASLPSLTTGVAFSQTLTSTGGTGPYTYTLDSGTLIPGTTLSSGGVLSGTPTQRNNYAFSVRSQDSLGAFTVKAYTGSVATPTLTIAPTSATAIQGQAFSQTLVTTGGIAPYTYALETGSFPAGITISSAGVVSGTTSAAPGNYAVTLRVTDSSTGGGSYFELESFTLTVAPPPSVSIAVAPASVSEDGATNLVYTVTRSTALTSPTVVNLTTSGTATLGTDYVGGVTTVSIPANATTATVTIDPTADTTVEANETVILTVATGSGYTVGAPASATGTILNDDVPALSIDNVIITEGNSGSSSATFTVSLSAPAGPGGVTYDIATADGTAIVAQDYSAAVFTGLTIPAGSSSATLNVLVIGDVVNEADETFFVNVTNVTGATVADGQGLGIITNDDAVPSLSINDVTVVEGNSGTTNAVFTVSLNTASGQSVSVNYATANGTAIQPADYTSTSGTLTFTAGQTTQTITVPVIGETLPETNETFFVTLSGGANATITDNQGQGTITNDDVPVTVSPTTLPGAAVAAAYSQTVTASGGAAPYSFAVTAGALPAGLTLSSGGVLSGTPTAGGSFAFTVTATDSSSTPGPYSGSQAYVLTIAVPTISLPATSLPTATRTQTYSASITGPSGGTAPYSYAVTASALPGGLTLNSSTGVISGTPSATGTFNFSITATDSSTGSGPYAATQSYSIVVNDAPPVASNSSLTVPYNAAATNVPLTLSGGAPTSLAIGTAPANGTATVSGTTISYQPTAGYAGPDSFTYTATNNGGTSAPATVTITVGNPTITIAASGSLNATVGSAYSQTFTWSGGTTPFSGYQVTNLPAGLAITGSTANSVTLSGTPTQAGSFALNASATDSSTGSGPFTVSQVFTLNVAAPTLTLTPNSGTFTVAYGGTVSQSFTAGGGTGPYTYAASGSLPAGVTLNSTSGLLSGSTIAVGSYSFTIAATDTGATGAGAPFTIARTYTLVVSPPVVTITPASLPGATVASSYSATLSASGGAAPYSFTVTAGALPAGLALSSSGGLSGTPTAGGSFSFTVTASDSSPTPGPFSASQTYTLVVAAPTITLPAMTLPDGQRGAAYSATLNAASGGTAPYSYAVTGGALPAGITFSSSGALSGTPTAFGSFAFTVTATDSTGGTGPYSANQSYTLAVVDQPPVAGPVSASVSYGASAIPITLNLTGGAATSVAVASAPANGTASASGTSISYQPNASFSGTDSFTYTATNGGGTSAPATVTITVGAPTLTVTAGGPLTATVGQPYSQTFSFAGGTEPFRSHQVTGLPAGLALTATSANSVSIAGTPRSQGTFTLAVSASDSSTGNGPFTANQNFTLTVAAPNLAITPASGTFTANYAASFSQTFTASGGIGSYTYALGGTLPAGVTLNSATGTVSGAPTATGSFAFTITATDTGATGSGAPFTVQGSYTLTVAAPTITVTPATLSNATAGTAYSATLAASGGVAPYTFSVTGGALPTGVTLASGGQLSGTPTASGSFTFTITARDANGQTAATVLTLNVNVPTLTITPTTLPAARQGIAYNQMVSASGGVAPYSFIVSSGTLPAGLALNTATGAITGTPTASGTANFAITVTDSTSGTRATATVNYALAVTARPDPAQDPEVRGLVQVQVTSTRRFADVQVNNFMQRLENLRGGGGSGGFRNSVRLSTHNYCDDLVMSWTNEACRKGESQLGQLANANGSGDGQGAGPGVDGSSDAPWTVWAGGTIRFGDRDPATGRLSQKFKSEGITIGADYRFSPSFAAGIGLGLGRDTIDIGDNGSQSRGEAKTIAIYGSHQLGRGFYIDWLGGYQWLDFNLRRYVTSTGALIDSERTGRQWFVTVSSGADIEAGNWLITPYARMDLTRGTLNGYTENSGSLFDLRFLDQDVNFSSIGLGTRIRYRHVFDGGVLEPRLRVEYRYDLERNADAQVAYLDLVSGPFSTIPLTGLSREQLTLGVGAELRLQSAIAIELEYLNRSASTAGSDHSVQAGITLKF